MIVAATISGDLGSLNLMSDPYRIEGPEGLDLGAVVWRRRIVTSPFAHGGFPVNQVKEMAQGAISISVRAANHGTLRTNIDTLLDHFYQFDYDLEVTFDGTAYKHHCYAADATVGMLDDRWDLLRVLVRLVYPRDPIPLTGPI